MAQHYISNKFGAKTKVLHTQLKDMQSGWLTVFAALEIIKKPTSTPILPILLQKA